MDSSEYKGGQREAVATLADTLDLGMIGLNESPCKIAVLGSPLWELQ